MQLCFNLLGVFLNPNLKMSKTFKKIVFKKLLLELAADELLIFSGLHPGGSGNAGPSWTGNFVNLAN